MRHVPSIAVIAALSSVLGCGGAATPQAAAAHAPAPRLHRAPQPAEVTEHAAPAAKRAAPIPDTPAKQPEALFGMLEVANLSGLIQTAAELAAAVRPDFKGKVSLGMLVAAVNAKLGAAVAGVELGKPVRILVVDPQLADPPVVAVVAVSDGTALEKFAAKLELQLQTHRGFAAIGQREALDAVAPWALSSLIAGDAPPQPRATVFLSRVVARYRPMVDAMLGKVASEAEATDAGEAGELAVGFMRALVDQVATVRAQLALRPDVSLQIAVVPKLDTRFAAVVAAQKPSSFAMLERQGDAIYSSGGAVDYQWMAEAMAGFSQTIRDNLAANDELSEGTGEILADLVARMNDWYALAGRESAESLDYAPGAGLRAQGEFELTDSNKAMTLFRDMTNVLVKAVRDDKKLDVIRLRFKQDALRHRGVKSDELTLRAKKLDAGEKKEMKRLFGGPSVHLLAAEMDNRMLIVIAGKKARDQMKALIDRVKGADQGKNRAAAGPGPQVAAAIAAAKERRESYLIQADVARIVRFAKSQGEEAGKPMAPAALGLGFHGGELALRITVPQPQIVEIVKLAAGEEKKAKKVSGTR